MSDSISYLHLLILLLPISCLIFGGRTVEIDCDVRDDEFGMIKCELTRMSHMMSKTGRRSGATHKQASLQNHHTPNCDDDHIIVDITIPLCRYKLDSSAIAVKTFRPS